MNVADLEQQLSQFWRQASTDDQAVMRACTHNLIVACEDVSGVADATHSVALLSEEFPGRVLMVVTTAGETGGGAEALRGLLWFNRRCQKQTCCRSDSDFVGV